MAIRAIGNANEHPPVQDQEHFVLVNGHVTQLIGGEAARFEHRYAESLWRTSSAQNKKTGGAVRQDKALVHGEHWSEG